MQSIALFIMAIIFTGVGWYILYRVDGAPAEIMHRIGSVSLGTGITLFLVAVLISVGILPF